MKAYYINLDSRLDRKNLVEREFTRLNYEFQRIPGIFNLDGLTGCAESHIKVLESCDIDSNYIWVSEDDIQFLANREYIDTCIQQFLSSDADILCLGNNSLGILPYSQDLLRSTDIQTTSSYIIKRKFRHILLDTWKDALVSRKNNDNKKYEEKLTSLNLRICEDYLALDQAWKILQKDYIFVIPKKKVLKQRSGYSDIMGKYVDYGV